jgi:hypothetical protein
VRAIGALILLRIGSVAIAFALMGSACASETPRAEFVTTAAPTTAAAPESTTTTTSAPLDRIVVYMDNPDEVRGWQNALNLYLDAGLTADGQFGPKTFAATVGAQELFAADLVIELRDSPSTTTTGTPRTTTTTAPRTTRAPVVTTAPTASFSCGADTYVNVDRNCIPRPRYDANGPPLGATAQCRDGTYSFSQNRSGTCSHHGGVASWL